VDAGPDYVSDNDFCLDYRRVYLVESAETLVN
jgi:hypothetical protein